jgi:hypothetical protein
MSPAQVQEKVQAIVERTTRDQGLQLQVTDPVALHRVAGLVLAVQGGGRDGTS